jgi:hypothetical protein
MDDETDKLLREFLLGQRQEEKRKHSLELQTQRAMQENTNNILVAFQSFTKQLTERFDAFSASHAIELAELKLSVKIVHELSLGTAARVTVLEEKRGLVAAQKAARVKSMQLSTPPTMPPAWDLGVESDTGSHYIIPNDQKFRASKEEWSVFLKEKLEEHQEVHDLREEAGTWRGWKENATKVAVGVCVAVVAAALIAALITTATNKVPAAVSPPPSSQH